MSCVAIMEANRNMVRSTHPSDCEDCKEIIENKGKRGYIDYTVDSKKEYIHNPTCKECSRIGRMQKAHYSKYGRC